jgi:hypothetical protein
MLLRWQARARTLSCTVFHARCILRVHVACRMPHLRPRLPPAAASGHRAGRDTVPQCIPRCMGHRRCLGWVPRAGGARPPRDKRRNRESAPKRAIGCALCSLCRSASAWASRRRSGCARPSRLPVPPLPLGRPAPPAWPSPPRSLSAIAVRCRVARELCGVDHCYRCAPLLPCTPAGAFARQPVVCVSRIPLSGRSRLAADPA